MSSVYGITSEEMIERFTAKQLAQLTSEPPSTTPDARLIEAKIAEAEAEFHVAAGVYYVTPIVAAGDATIQQATDLFKMIRGKILDIAAYKLLQKRPEWLNAGERAFYWSQIRKANDAWLAQIAAPRAEDRMALTGATPREVIASPSGGAFVESDDNPMTRERLKGWK